MKLKDYINRTREAKSPPARGRGLKFAKRNPVGAAVMSPPARGRGLKSDEEREVLAMARRPLRGGVD